MMSGSPPTERKARTGLFTPPTRSFVARSKISRERRRSRCKVGRVAFISRSKKDEERNLTQRAQRTQRVQRRLWSPGWSDTPGVLYGCEKKGFARRGICKYLKTKDRCGGGREEGFGANES